ncbi:sulfite exporter TauE/SafE family protein [Desulfobulbus elongatus]|uniref:sulfite exporter TauE/SafE family protein n=1 Tax=Desulfobulbus elongatus TaxID=53332 RepID=UPI00047F734C|nr:sulfite exporter TauE/SafE family protein [Desulfobulbus elongatus]
MTVLLLSCLVFLLAGLIQGLTGFGGGLVAIPLLCLLMDVKLAVPLSILSGLAITTTMAFELRRLMDWRKILPMLVGSLPGVFAGTFLLKLADPAVINRMLGVLLIAISAVNLTIRPRPLNPHVAWGYIAGFFSGAITASVGAGGPPVIIYTTLTDWKKDEIKATLTGFFVLNGYITAVVHACSGMITRSTLTAFAASLAFVLAGTYAGSAISGRINRRTYLRVVYALLMALGIVMLAR